MQQYNVIGIMSGSSMDGVDLCYAEFYVEEDRWKYKNIVAETLPYPLLWSNRLKKTGTDRAEEFCKTDADFGRFLGESVNSFIKKNDFIVHLISSHGHTIFHQPHHGFTSQIGDGAAIYGVTGIRTVSNLRNVDVALGGQGAPLVPVGERDLFENYGMFLNLGGIANISVFDLNQIITAFDISPFNMVMNMLCEKYFNRPFDSRGELASRGKCHENLLLELEQIPFFKQRPPKSLGREFALQTYMPIIEKYNCAAEDKLHTVSLNIASQISKVINSQLAVARKKNLLATGGGVYNTWLLELLKQKSHLEITVPAPFLIEFKEALIFAYLGVLRLTRNVNALSSVTNARRDSIGGALWG